MVLSVTMRTRPAKTVVKLVTVNMIVPSNATSLRVSSVASAVMLVTWLGIVQIDSAARTGEMVDLRVVCPAVQMQDALVPAMLLTESTRYVSNSNLTMH